MTTGSCLCGTVRWEATGEPTDMAHCHCSMCRKAHAAAFVTWAVWPRAKFSWLSGQESIATYRSSASGNRAFCRQCGAALPADSGEGEMLVPAGGLDTDPGKRPNAHIFVGSKAPWHEIADRLPRFEAWPPGMDMPAVDRPRASEPKEGVLAGSCLCGDVLFEVSEPFKAVHNCHCSRCRKARAAAHTTNGFASQAGLRFVRGGDKLVSYKLPEAKFFTHTFCARCGSGMPRADAARGIAVIPFGALDDDPGRGADDHIYVAYKAPWYDIADRLPTFDEAPG